MSSPHFHRLRVAQVQPEADDALLLCFDVPEPLREAFRFQPGQHLTLRSDIAGQDVRRSYSICAVPGEPLRVGVRCVSGGVFSGWLRDSLRAGDEVDVMPPQGSFGAALAVPSGRPRGGRHVLAIAGGSGITPILSIIQSVLANEPASRVTLLYGNRSAASTMFCGELDDLKNRWMARLALHHVVSRESVDSPLHSGRLDQAKLATLLRLCGAVHTVDEAFVCGPHAMNDEAEAVLLAAGWLPSQVHIERFGVPASAANATLHLPQAGDAQGAVIVIVRDGLTRSVRFESGDTSILAAAARSGLDLPYACRSGVCATCRATVLEGQVRMDRNFALEAAEVATGQVLACQAHPLSERVVLSFDGR
jgi:ring-1,2-phenylacetyl-CoA epoxidase subunit PaaE